MTASPAAVAPPPTGQTDGSNALAALFASMHCQLASPPTTKQSVGSNVEANKINPTKYSDSIKANINNDAAAAVAMLAAITSKSSPSKATTTPLSTSTSKTRKHKTSETSLDGSIKKVENNKNVTVNQFLVNLMNRTPPRDSPERKQGHNHHQQQQTASSPTKSCISASTSECSSGERQREQLISKKQSTQKVTKTQQSAIKDVANTAASPSTPIRPTKVVPSQGHKITASKLIDKVTCEMTGPNNSNVELRNLETWHDEDEELMDESCYQELVDLGNTNGWSADEMFKYNEKRHKITSNYTDKTLGDKYTTPLPKIKSKTTHRMATKLAKEIEDDNKDGRVTPESSDDDEIFELERTRRIQLKQSKQLDQLKTLKAVNSLSIHNQNGRSSSSSNSYNPHVDLNGSSGSGSDGSSTSATNGRCKLKKVSSRRLHRPELAAPPAARYNQRHYQQQNNGINGDVRVTKSSRQSNSSATPVTASLSSSPTLNDSISNHNHLHHHHATTNNNHQVFKPPTSSSRNILRTCLT